MPKNLSESEKVSLRQIRYCYSAGKTMRWHTNNPPVLQPENIAAHSWNVVSTILLLHPNPSVELIKTAHFHDAAEHVTGDMPRWAKAKPAVQKAMHEAEDDVMALYNLPSERSLNEEDQRWLKGADLFDVWMFFLRELRLGNRMVIIDYQKVDQLLQEYDLPGELKEVYLAIKWSKV